MPVNLTASPYSGYTHCPRGYFCPIQTGLNWQSCPPGTYSNKTGLHSVTQCEDCPQGKYCANNHATTYTNLCDGGFYCTNGVDRSNPIQNVSILVGNCTQLGLHTG